MSYDTNNPAVNDAADAIRAYSPECADAFRSQPFNRVDIACAFARGFVKNESDDIHPVAGVVIEIAYADQRARQAHYAHEVVTQA